MYISGWEKQSQKSENSSSADVEMVTTTTPQPETEEVASEPETEIDLNEEEAEEVMSRDSPDLAPSRKLHEQRPPSRGQIVTETETVSTVLDDEVSTVSKKKERTTFSPGPARYDILVCLWVSDRPILRKSRME